MNMNHMKHIREIVEADCEMLVLKEATYHGSWKKRGGVGAFMMMARKWDRIENMIKEHGLDIFEAIGNNMDGDDGTILAEIIDLRCYLLLIHAEMESRNTPTGSTEQESPFGHTEEEDENSERHSIDATSSEFCGIRPSTIRHGSRKGYSWGSLYEPADTRGRFPMVKIYHEEYGR